MSKPAHTASYWAVIPAAGVGSRMQADRPKQYLVLDNKTVIEHTLDRLLSIDAIQGAVLSLSDTDEYWPELDYQSSKPVLIANGGRERADSVLNALLHLQSNIQHAGNVRVLVHDAARPCVRSDDIEKLIEQASDDNGGLLALSVRDTMKRDNQLGRVSKTVERKGLWHALTPQMFRLDLLINALQQANQQGLAVTDDASAMELAGYQPRLIEAHEDNIKITRAFDLQLAHLFMQHQQNS